MTGPRSEMDKVSEIVSAYHQNKITAATALTEIRKIWPSYVPKRGRRKKLDPEVSKRTIKDRRQYLKDLDRLFLTGRLDKETYERARRNAPKTLDPELKTRKKLIANPQVLNFHDYKGSGMIRVLTRLSKVSQGKTFEDWFPEFALYVKKADRIVYSLKGAGFTDEGKGKWVLRTNKFNIFMFI